LTVALGRWAAGRPARRRPVRRRPDAAVGPPVRGAGTAGLAPGLERLVEAARPSGSR
jgi:hypothetical protein